MGVGTDGSGYGSGDGDYGTGDGDGYGDGYSSGTGDGDGYGTGYGYGYGTGEGDGTGDGYGNGYGYGYGDVIVDHSTPIIAYHCVPTDGRLRYPHAGERPRVHVGLMLEHDPDLLELCSVGLHASLTPEDAGKFCKGILTRVACSGRVIFGADKLVCSRREVVEILEGPI